MLELPRSAVFLAIDNPGLFRVTFQTASLEPAPYGLQYRAGLLLGFAVDDGIVRVTFELDISE
jgi:hypothetical protein